MNKGNNLAHENEDESSAKDQIKRSLQQANSHAVKREAKQTRLSSNFLTSLKKKKEESSTINQTELECEQAMLTLSTDYVAHLEALKQASRPEEISRCLLESELVWEKETKKILSKDSQKSEKKFFQEMRSFLFLTLSHKLEDHSKKAKLKPTQSNIQSAIDILNLQDKILLELGHPEESAERSRLKELRMGFKL
jgi:hypothetical protein